VVEHLDEDPRVRAHKRSALAQPSLPRPVAGGELVVEGWIVRVELLVPRQRLLRLGMLLAGLLGLLGAAERLELRSTSR
jgi:hypothetical protein